MGIAVVSGSASGIGAATRKRLEADGDKVVGIDIRDAEITADLSTPEGRATAISQALEACNGRIDRLVLSAGLSELHPLHLVVKVNYFGAMALLDGFREALKAGSDPSAVLLCSNSARTEAPRSRCSRARPGRWSALTTRTDGLTRGR